MNDRQNKRQPLSSVRVKMRITSQSVRHKDRGDNSEDQWDIPEDQVDSLSEVIIDGNQLITDSLCLVSFIWWWVFVVAINIFLSIIIQKILSTALVRAATNASFDRPLEIDFAISKGVIPLSNSLTVPSGNVTFIWLINFY